MNKLSVIACFLSAGLTASLGLYAQSFTTLYSFTPAGGNGYEPYSGVIVGLHGELYGTTPFGGAWKQGIVYELVPPASPGGPWAEVPLHSFTNQNGGGQPTAGLLLGPGGTLYGVTGYGSTSWGKVLSLTPPTAPATHWRESVLYNFQSTNGDGEGPAASLVFGLGRSLYGTTQQGGLSNSYGTVFSLAPPSVPGGPWTEAVLYAFGSQPGDGTTPLGTLAVAPNGTLYGTTSNQGPLRCSGGGGGTVFQLSPPAAPGANWTETVLHEFNALTGDGSCPQAGVVMGAKGVLYGATWGGGLSSTQQCGAEDGGNYCGVAFLLAPPTAPGGSWTETILHAFQGTPDGSRPLGNLAWGPGGVLYGATFTGGAYDRGTLYELLPPSSPGGAWTEVVLYSFTGGADGNGPNGVVFGPDGALYGTTALGGASNFGVVFKFVPQN